MDRKFDLLGKPCVPCPLGSTINEMPRVRDPFRFLLIALSGWMNQRQLPVIDCLREENRARSGNPVWIV